jgi:hypothetical protein
MNTDIDYIQKLVTCYQNKCAKYQKKMKQERDKVFIFGDKLTEDFKNNKISKKEFLKLASEAEKKYLNSVAHLKHLKCSLDNCYDLTKAKIDAIAKRNNYTKPNLNKYDEKYHNKIMLLNYINMTKEFLKTQKNALK